MSDDITKADEDVLLFVKAFCLGGDVYQNWMRGFEAETNREISERFATPTAPAGSPASVTPAGSNPNDGQAAGP